MVDCSPDSSQKPATTTPPRVNYVKKGALNVDLELLERTASNNPVPLACREHPGKHAEEIAKFRREM